MKLYFVRHGESEANVLRVISNRGLMHGLTVKGREQSELLADRLKDRGIAHIFSSPLLRGVETAEVLSQRLGVGFEVTDALAEYDCGIIEGRSDPASWQLHAQISDAWLKQHEWDLRIEGGENFLDMQRRFVPFVAGLVGGRDTPGGGNLALVGHGGLYRCMLPLVLENIDFDFAITQAVPNTGYILAEVVSGRLVCREWCGLAVPGEPAAGEGE